MAQFHFRRYERTPHSEVYRILEEGEEMGEVHINFHGVSVFADLYLGEDPPRRYIQRLVETIHHDLVGYIGMSRVKLFASVNQSRYLGDYNFPERDERRRH